MSYDLKDLRLFKAIADAQNLSLGAAAMYMTASSASYRLKNLEYALGGALFIRTPKGMTLTPAGEALVRHANKLLAGADAMQAEISEYSKKLKGSIKLLANSSSLNSFIIPSLARFLATNLNINVDLKEEDSPSIARKIQAGEADIGVVAGQIATPDLRSELYAIERLICAVSLDHPLAGRSKVSFLEMLNCDLVCMERKSSNFLFLDYQARQAGKPINVRVHAHDFNSVLYFVEANVGVALVPATVADELIRERRISGLSIIDAWAFRDLHLITRREPAPSDLIQEFAEILLHDPQVAATRSKLV